MIAKLVLVFSIALGGAFGAFPEVPDARIDFTRDDAISYRLPTDTVPISYDVTLEPFFDTFEFDGKVTILIEVVEATDTITMHAAELIIDFESIVVREENAVEVLPIASVTNDTTFEYLIIGLQDQVQPEQRLQIDIEYVGFLNDDNRGFYRAKYEEDGVTKWFGTTQFESTSARRAFPSYDEPALKATFTIHIIRPTEYNSTSNMRQTLTEPYGADKEIDHYEESVKMPTYLVAFIVSEMDYVEDGDQRVYAAPVFIKDNRTDYALEAGIKILEAMTEFTNVPYSLDKMYQAAIPNDWFAAGAMENWGLVTYRERYLLYKEGISTAADKQTIATIVAHEYGHQWFGNLVSPLWWEYIWLNEGFATYFEHYAASVAEPTMALMDQFVPLTNQYAMENDGLASTRPMSWDAQTPAEISRLFDRVAYEKSGAVIRMMEHMLTTNVFKRGLTIYLEAKEFDAAQPSDLWAGLQAAIDETTTDNLGGNTFAEIMETWNSQAGYPVVNVERENGKIVLSQSRFLLLDPEPDTSEVWTIPINYATNSSSNFSDTRATYWLKGAREETDIEIGEDEWIILNKQSTGYFRVNYDEESWRLIINRLNSTSYDSVHLLSRSQLIDDAWNLARSGRLSYRTVFDFFTYLHRESDYVPLYSFFRGLVFMNRFIMSNTDQYEIFKVFLQNILQRAYTVVGTTDGGTHTTRLNRINILTWLCRYEHEGCLNAMHTQLAAAQGVAPDMQQLVYCGGLLKDEDTETKWNFLFERYQGGQIEELERVRILSALGCTTSEEHLNRWLGIIVGTDATRSIPAGDRATAFSGVVASSKIGLETAFDFVLSNFETITSLPFNTITSFFNTLVDRLTTEEQKERLEEFITSLPQASQTAYQDIFNNARNTIDVSINWSGEYFEEEITEWLQEYGNGYVFGISIPLLLATLLCHLFA